jgi:hypothetical protein
MPDLNDGGIDPLLQHIIYHSNNDTPLSKTGTIIAYTCLTICILAMVGLTIYILTH